MNVMRIDSLRQITPERMGIIFDYLLYDMTDDPFSEDVYMYALAQRAMKDDDFFPFILDKLAGLKHGKFRALAYERLKVSLAWYVDYLIREYYKLNHEYYKYNITEDAFTYFHINRDPIQMREEVNFDLIREVWQQLKDNPDDFITRNFINGHDD